MSNFLRSHRDMAVAPSNSADAAGYHPSPERGDSFGGYAGRHERVYSLGGNVIIASLAKAGKALGGFVIAMVGPDASRKRAEPGIRAAGEAMAARVDYNVNNLLRFAQ